ncbi:triose-phosphate isomerase [Patescibacteria group bacterium]|nr:triose-phosphate isomerase [Patescibacteria group bacterium]
MKYVIGNWKMNLGIRESIAMARVALRSLQGKEDVPVVVICPSATALSEVRKVVARTRIELGSQNIGPGKAGAYTGELGGTQLQDVGVTYAIIGHSERRQAGEDEAILPKRFAAAFEVGITPVLCVGEPAEIRAGSASAQYVREQVRRALKGVAVPRGKRFLVAYEPIFAIGTGTSASVPHTLEIIEHITAVLLELGFDDVPVLYGGSVNAQNVYSYLREPQISGVLVGSASVQPQEFPGIVASACDVMSAQKDI